MTEWVLAIAAAAAYLVSGGIIGMRLFQYDHAPPKGVALAIGWAGVAIHAVALFQDLIGANGINLGMFNAFSLAAWFVLVLFLLSAIAKPVENLGIVLLPAAALAVLMQIAYPSMHFLPPTASWGLRLHVLLSFLAYSLLTLASVQAVLLAIQDHHLHNRHPGGFVRALPPLQTMEDVLFQLIGAGFVLLSLALLSGFLFLTDIFAQHLVHKTVLSIAAWLVFATLLTGRIRAGWRGRKALIGTLIGFGVLMLAYFGSRFVLDILLQR